MSLSSGTYVVTSLLGNRFVGRSIAETTGLDPKPVFALPEGSIAPLLTLEKNAQGYRIKAGGSPLGIVNGAVHALINGEEPEDWIISAAEGNSVFTVRAAEGNRGWVRASDEGNFGFEIMVSAFPPRFPPSRLFVFSPIDRN